MIMIIHHTLHTHTHKKKQGHCGIFLGCFSNMSCWIGGHKFNVAAGVRRCCWFDDPLSDLVQVHRLHLHQGYPGSLIFLHMQYLCNSQVKSLLSLLKHAVVRLEDRLARPPWQFAVLVRSWRIKKTVSEVASKTKSEITIISKCQFSTSMYEYYGNIQVGKLKV